MKLFLYRHSKFICQLLPSLLALTTFAQTTEELNKYKVKYPGQHVVCKNETNTVTIRVVKDEPVITQQYKSEELVLDKSGVIAVSEGRIRYSGFEIVNELEAYSMVPTQKGSKKVAATNFVTQDAKSKGYIFHDDTKETNFLYPGICEGALCVLDYTVQYTDNTFPFDHRFSGYRPVENSSFIIDCDTSVHLLVKEFYMKDIAVVFTDVVERNKRILTWTVNNPAYLKDETFAPKFRYYVSHVLAQIAYHNGKKGRKQYTETIKDLHDNYKDNVKEVENETPSAELKAIADSVSVGLTTDLDKVKAVYYWVQDQIKYIAFEEGKGGFVPRQPSAVLVKRYGDCKDMASLIYSMLKSINVTSYLTWVGSRDLPYRYTDFPSSFCDNHMIAVYKEKDKYYFLDATNSLQAHDIPTSFIQGKQALMHLSPDKFEVIEIPIAPTNVSYMRDTSYVKIDKFGLKGNSKTIVGGYYRSVIGGYLKNVPAKELDEALKSLNTKGNNSYNVKNGKISNLADRDKPVQFSFDFTVDNYVTQFENEIYVNMVLEKDITHQSELNAPRIAPYENDYKVDDLYTVILDIPEGYSVKSIPPGKEYTSDLLTYKISYERKGKQVIMNLHMKLDFLLLYPEQFNQWNEFLKVKKSSFAEALVLVKN